MEARGEQWTLSDVGNWDTYKIDANNDAATGFADGEYDDTGDLDQDREHNKANEIADTNSNGDAIETTFGPDWADPTHDARGNMTTIPRPNDPASTYTCTYDAWNRLVKVAAGETTVAEYRYDGLHRRIARLVPNDQNWDRTDFYYTRSWQVIEERYAADQADEDAVATAAKVQYVWSLRYIDACVLRDEDKNSDGNCIDAGDERLYYCNGSNMNVFALVDDSGDVQERYVYDAYGKVTIYDDDWSDTLAWSASKKNEILYCGYRYDSEIGLFHVRFRMYHPTLGRWMQRDSLEYPDGLNTLEYATSNPAIHVDPEGTGITIVPPDPDKPESELTYVNWLLGEHKLPTTKKGTAIWGTCTPVPGFRYKEESSHIWVIPVRWKCADGGDTAYLVIMLRRWIPDFKFVIGYHKMVPGEAAGVAKKPAEFKKAIQRWNEWLIDHEMAHAKAGKRIFTPVTSIGFGWDCNRLKALRQASKQSERIYVKLKSNMIKAWYEEGKKYDKLTRKLAKKLIDDIREPYVGKKPHG